MIWVDQSEMPCISSIMWHLLAEVEGDRVCLNDGEVWQYMGSKREGSKLIHTFRHRCHPSDSQQHYRHITTSLLGEEVKS